MIDDQVFWKAYDQASENAQAHPFFDELEMQKDLAFKLAGVSEELRELIENSLYHEHIMITWEMWKNTNRCCRFYPHNFN